MNIFVVKADQEISWIDLEATITEFNLTFDGAYDSYLVGVAIGFVNMSSGINWNKQNHYYPLAGCKLMLDHCHSKTFKNSSFHVFVLDNK